jgi:hypothetical protein
MSSNRDNPWLSGYGVRSPGEVSGHSAKQHPESTGTTEERPLPATAGTGSPGSAEYDSPPEPPPPIRSDRRSIRQQWIIYAFVMTMGAVAAAFATRVMAFVEKKWDNMLPDPLEIPAPSSDDDLFAAQIQIRGTKEEGRRYLGENSPLLGVFEHWNSSEGLFKYGDIPKQRPVLIPEARPGHWVDFQDLVFKGFKDIKVYAFEYKSEDHLYRVASKCGLPSRLGVKWIVQWSSWKEGGERIDQTRCKAGGWCILLSRGCDADTFDDLSG